MTRPSVVGSASVVGLGAVATAAAAHEYLATPSSEAVRPKMVTDALANNAPIHYFGVGSNMSRTKLETRALGGKRIRALSIEPAVVPNHRLAFNMMGFPPLEPGFASLEPLHVEEEGQRAEERDAFFGDRFRIPPRRRSSMPLLSYDEQECHGALIRLSAKDYQRVFLSEAGGTGKYQRYEEIVVTVVPYNESRPPVKAVAFTTRDFKRLDVDAAPSLCYMNMLRQGAKELGLKACYKKWLDNHPVQQNTHIVNLIANHNLLIGITLIFNPKWKVLQALHGLQDALLYKSYVPPTQRSIAKRIVGEVVTGMLLLPGSIVGFGMRTIKEMRGTMDPKTKEFVDRNVKWGLISRL